mmetsp:Transcript_102941/g.193687  ORF Transcript_102941/g.193687 Transcript_102941/m.193687 type:complete len:178 (-) Transcript_102941:2-535(-)
MKEGQATENLAHHGLHVLVRERLLAVNNLVEVRWHVRKHEEDVLEVRAVHGGEVDEVEQILMMQACKQSDLPQDALPLSASILDMLDRYLLTRIGVLTQIHSAKGALAKLPNAFQVGRHLRGPLDAIFFAIFFAGHLGNTLSLQSHPGTDGAWTSPPMAQKPKSRCPYAQALEPSLP